MDPLLITSLVANVGLIALSVYLSLREEHLRKQYVKQEVESMRKGYQVSVFNEFLGSIGSSLDVRTVADSITSISERLFRFSAISYAVMNNKEIQVSHIVKEPVSDEYRARVAEIMLQSLRSVNHQAQYYNVSEAAPVNEHGSKHTLSSDRDPLSYFNIPLVLGDEVVGVITVSSRRPHDYKEEDMDVLYKVVERTENAFHRLRLLIDSEKNTLSSLISSLPGGAMLFSVQGTHLILSYINRVAREFLHIESMQPDAMLAISAFNPKDKISECIQESIRDKKSTILREKIVYDKYFNLYVNPVFYGTEKVVAVSVTMQDVTLEKEIERIREDFIHMVVHELRAPLTSIKGASDLLLTQKLADDQREKMLTIVNDSTKRMLNDINDLLDAAKIGSGKLTIVPEEADINAIVTERAQAFRFLAEQKRMSISVKTDDSVPKFFFDSMRIGQVVNNYVSNAIKYSSEGGTILVGTRLEGDRCVVFVKDDGAGIPADKQKSLFSKFGQVGTGLRKTGSTGLGLYVSKGIVESHEGKLWVESEVGHGATFFFSLPLRKKADEKVSDDSRILSGQAVVN